MTDGIIVAISTPPGRGGLGVVRLSGDSAFEVLRSLFGGFLPPMRRATMAEFKDQETGRVLDRVILTCFAGPRSYTGEDVAEISCHGAPVILKYLVECCVRKGARPAEPGEFTLRAFLNGRIDLTQAEAVRDLIDARTLFQARVAAQQMGGSVSARVKPWKETLVQLIARLEAGIDFAEDDVPIAANDSILPEIDRLRDGLAGIAAGYKYGRIVREGIVLAIVGRPNVGKSSLFNRLLGQDRAIVTEAPGTTRDLVTETADLGGIPVRLADTAGIRESGDEVEKIGVSRSLEALADADLRLLVLDAAAGFGEDDARLLRKIRPHGPMVIALNKCDLVVRISEDDVERAANLAELKPESQPPRITIVRTSALTGEGIEDLKAELVAASGGGKNCEGEFITNLRHLQALERAEQSLAQAHAAAAGEIPHEMVLLDLYDALRELDLLTGSTTTDDVLGVIFSTFCVGK
ncbi:MAG: tRNA uridine-5-carboxymethylaminomethyl(34) synthesis GTPase MnmE [Acidobacteriota bacterium]|nr:tRNA uridine-5-carboxymethylaminomethyl(34) synthesis GTPase MnmE [Acidobacteriota bacterium]